MYFHPYDYDKNVPLVPKYGIGKINDCGDFEWCDEDDEEASEGYWMFPNGEFNYGNTPYGPCKYNSEIDCYMTSDGYIYRRE